MTERHFRCDYNNDKMRHRGLDIEYHPRGVSLSWINYVNMEVPSGAALLTNTTYCPI